jgi:DNA/RNA non-specific endonuclease
LFDGSQCEKQPSRSKRALDFKTYTDYFRYNVIDLVRNSESSRTRQELVRPNRPTITYTTSEHNGVQVVHSMRATINRNNIPTPGSTRPNQPSGYIERMDQLDRINGDEAGHLMALSIGGPNELINLVPQHATTNRNLGRNGEINSFWRHTETEVQRFARTRGVTSVDWYLYIEYERNENLRPSLFAVRYIAHYDNNDNFTCGDSVFPNNH